VAEASRNRNVRRLAVVTGASSGIGLELARLCADDGHDLVICSDEAEIEAVAAGLRHADIAVQAVHADLSDEAGVMRLWAVINDRPVDYLMANAGTGVGGAFLDQAWEEHRRVIGVNVIGTTMLVHRVAGSMRARGQGRILVTGSIVGRIPGTFNAVYNASKAYLELFAYAIRNEMQAAEVTVTILMPGPTDTAFFDRAGMQDSPMAQDLMTADPAKVARDGYDAMMQGKGGITSGFLNKLQAMFADVIPDKVLASMHRHIGSAGRDPGEKGRSD